MQILLDNKGKVEGVKVEGRVLQSNVVLSCATPKITFGNLLTNKDLLPSEYLNSLQNIDYTSPVTKINVAVNKLPNFLADPNQKPNQVMPHHRCTIHLNCEDSQLLEEAYADAAFKGTFSAKPMIELTIPSR